MRGRKKVTSIGHGIFSRANRKKCHIKNGRKRYRGQG